MVDRVVTETEMDLAASLLVEGILEGKLMPNPDILFAEEMPVDFAMWPPGQIPYAKLLQIREQLRWAVFTRMNLMKDQEKK